MNGLLTYHPYLTLLLKWQLVNGDSIVWLVEFQAETINENNENATKLEVGKV